jgi:hypothetical protein
MRSIYHRHGSVSDGFRPDRRFTLPTCHWSDFHHESGSLQEHLGNHGCRFSDARELVGLRQERRLEQSENRGRNGAHQFETAAKLVGQGIEITDEDWKAGNKLLNFSIKNASSQPQQGPRVVVLLNMQRRNGKKVDSEIAYEVILADKVKISRDAFHIPQ